MIRALRIAASIAAVAGAALLLRRRIVELGREIARF